MKDQDLQRVLLFAVRLSGAGEGLGKGLDTGQVLSGQPTKDLLDLTLMLSRGEKLKGLDV